MTFPDKRYRSAAEYLNDYAGKLSDALAAVDREALQRAVLLLTETHGRSGIVWCCGNGGSAAIANHLVCDHSKGVHADTGLRPRVQSLSANVEIITAIANDIGYEDSFVHQLRLGARASDLLITISASGDSENVVRAAQWARKNKVAVIAMTGFGGGRTAALADVHLHVRGDNYGVIEDAHQAIMHVLAQYLRQGAMPEQLIASRKF